jgi:acyl-CoA reductase-like NAD-dependent aldehyde dehydrogenase
MLKIINPATEETIRELPEDNAKTIAEKFARAKTAQIAWAERPLAERTKILKKFLDLIMADSTKEKLARTLTTEMGKPVQQARNELNALSGRIGFFLENTASVLADESVLKDPSQKLEETITHEPLGVIGNISAWNYPYFVGSNVFVPALLTGNAVLYKPSEFATLTGLEIERLLHEAGVPKDVFVSVIG